MDGLKDVCDDVIGLVVSYFDVEAGGVGVVYLDDGELGGGTLADPLEVVSCAAIGRSPAARAMTASVKDRMVRRSP